MKSSVRIRAFFIANSTPCKGLQAALKGVDTSLQTPRQAAGARWECPVLQEQVQASSLTGCCPSPVAAKWFFYQTVDCNSVLVLSLHGPVSAKLFKPVASAQWGLLTVFPEKLIGIRTLFKEEGG